MKFILHSISPDNLILMARAAKHCVTRGDIAEGHWGVVMYESAEGPVASISYVKRKSCITLYEQPKP